MAETFPEIMTIEETAHYLRIPLSSLYRLAQAGKIPCQKVGRHWRFKRQAIDHWLGEIPRAKSTSNEEDVGTKKKQG